MRYRIYLDKEGKKLYYAGYLPGGGGPILTENPADAFRFQSLVYAENFMGTDDRFSAKAGAKIERIQ